MMKCPCENCLILPICKYKNVSDIIASCTIIQDFLKCSKYGYTSLIGAKLEARLYVVAKYIKGFNN